MTEGGRARRAGNDGDAGSEGARGRRLSDLSRAASGGREGTGVALRAATPEDVPAITEVFLECWRISYSLVLPPALIDSMSDEDALALWARSVANPASEVVVAEEDGRILGVTSFGPGPAHSAPDAVAPSTALSGSAPSGPDAVAPSGLIHSLYVSPRAQGKGVGSRLIREAVRALADGGARVGYLWVFADNAPSLAFYRHHGWSETGETQVEEEFGEPEIRLTRPLA